MVLQVLTRRCEANIDQRFKNDHATCSAICSLNTPRMLSQSRTEANEFRLRDRGRNNDYQSVMKWRLHSYCPYDIVLLM